MGAHRLKVRTAARPPPPASQQRAVEEFWRRRQEEIEATVDFKERMLPMARLKKVIRAEEDGMMISADIPAFLTKLCELFVQELAVRAWACAESRRRCIILDSDIAEAVASTECYDFLVNVLLRYLAAKGGSSTPTARPAARLITRKRHRLDPASAASTHHLHRQVRAGVQFSAIPPPPPAASAHYMPSPPCMLLSPPSVARDLVFFMNGNSTNSYPAAYCSPFAVTNNVVEPFASGNTDPNVVATEFVEGNIVNYCGDADRNCGALGIAAGQQQQGGDLEGILMMDEDLLFLDDDPLGLEDFMGDQDVLDGAFSNPSSSTSSS